MPQLEQIYIKNAGHKEAYYDDFSLVLNGLDGLPGHTALNLKNGGGKTTLMNLFFSMILADRRKVTTPKRKFEDNFKRNGVSFIIARWVKFEERPLGSSKVSFYTGSCIQNGPSIQEQKVKYFSFRVSENFNLSSFNFKEFRQLEDFSKWFNHQKGHFGPNSLAIFENGKKWREHLVKLGFVIEHFELMCEMNKFEGDIETILSFENDSDFAKKVLDLIVQDDPQRQAMIREHFDDLTDLPNKRQNVQAMSEIIQKMEQTVEPVANLEEAREEAEDLRVEWTRFRQKTVATVLKVFDLHTRVGLDLSHTESELKASSENLEEQYKRKQYFEYRETEERIWELKITKEKNERILKRCEVVLAKMTVAPSIIDLKGYEDALDEIKRRETSAPEEERNLAYGLGTGIRNRLQETKVNVASEIAHDRQKIKSLSCQLKDDRQEKEDKAGEITSGERELREVRQWLKEYRKERERIFQDAEIEDKKKGVRDRIEETLTRIKTLKQTDKSLIEQEKKLSNQKGELDSSIRHVARYIEKIEKNLSAFEAAEESLKNDPLLQEILENDVIENLYHESVLRVIDAELAELDIPGIEAQISRLEHLVGKIREHEYLPQSDDVDKVLNHFKSKHYPVFLMSHYLRMSNFSTENIRDMIAKDPGMFGGLVAQSKEVFDKIVQEDLSGIVNGPISIAYVEGDIPEPWERNGIHVYMPNHNLWYDLEECRLKKDEFQDKIERLEKDLSRRNQQKNALEDLKERIRDFILIHPAGTRESIQKDLDEKRESKTSHEDDRRQILEELKRIGEKRKETSNAIENLETQHEELQDELRVINQFIRQWEDKKKPKEQREVDLLENLPLLKERVDELTVMIDGKEKEINELQQKINNDSILERDLIKQIDGVAYYHQSGQPAEDVVDLDHAINQYQHLAKVLENAESADREKQRQIDETRARIDEVHKNLKRMGADTHTIDAMKTDIARTRKYSCLQGSGKLNRAKQIRDRVMFVKDNAGLELDRLEKTLRKMVKPEESFPEQDVRAALKSSEEAISRLEERVDKLKNDKKELQARKRGYGTEFGQYIQHLNEDMRISDTKREDIHGLLGHTTDVSGIETFDDQDVCYRIKRDLKTRIRNNENKVNQLEKTLKDSQEEINIIAMKDMPNSPVTQGVKNMEFGQCKAVDVTNQIRNMTDVMQAVQEEIENVQPNEDKIIEYAKMSCENLLIKMGQINRHSKIPKDIQDPWSKWREKSFFEVNMSRIDEKRLRETVKKQLEHHYKRNEVPGSYKIFLKNIVMSYLDEDTAYNVKAFKVFDPPSGNRHPISDYGGFSGGQKVAAAIIFYIALSKTINPATANKNILFLDNPFAKCNNIDYVQLQFEVAKMYGVQLIYATGYDILHSADNFDRFITLKRTALDNGGFLHVEVVQ